MQDLEQSYSQWQKDPTPGNLSKVVEGLRPTVDGMLGTLGVSDDPTIRTKAKAITAQAVTKYDPTKGAQLHTWVANSLKDLHRYKRKVQGFGLPERTQLDAWNIHKATQELADKLGRDPDTIELSDYAGIPVKRIKEVRQANRKNVAEGVGLEGQVSGSDYVDEAVNYLMPELDPVGRKILEHRTGFAGAQVKDAKVLAQELGLSEPTVSRKAADLAGRLTEIMNNLKQVYGG